MKKIITYLFLIFLFISCSEKYNDILQYESSIPYEKGFAACQKDIQKVIRLYEKRINKNTQEWNSYSQLCQFYKKLFIIHKFITEEEFLEKELSVYETWLAFNPNDKNHLVPYGFLLIANGNDEKGTQYLTDFYSNIYVYNYSDPTQQDIIMFFCSLALGKIKREDYDNTIYSNCFDFSMLEIVEMFCGV